MYGAELYRPLLEHVPYHGSDQRSVEFRVHLAKHGSSDGMSVELAYILQNMCLIMTLMGGV